MSDSSQKRLFITSVSFLREFRVRGQPRPAPRRRDGERPQRTANGQPQRIRRQPAMRQGSSQRPPADRATGCRSGERCCMSANVGSTAMVTFHFGSFSWPERENEEPRSQSVGPSSDSAAPGDSASAAHAGRRATPRAMILRRSGLVARNPVGTQAKFPQCYPERYSVAIGSLGICAPWCRCAGVGDWGRRPFSAAAAD